MPPPAAGWDYSPQTLGNAQTENQAYSHWTGYQAEINLANEVANTGQTVLKWGDEIGAQGNDIISVDPNTGDVALWDSKYRSNSVIIGQSPTYANDTTRAAALAEAQEVVSESNLSADIQRSALQNLRSGNFTTNTVGSGGARNSVQVTYVNGQPTVTP